MGGAVEAGSFARNGLQIITALLLSWICQHAPRNERKQLQPQAISRSDQGSTHAIYPLQLSVKLPVELLQCVRILGYLQSGKEHDQAGSAGVKCIATS